jgi:hypothetical protein
MTLISIKNTSAGNTIIPARGGLGLVVGAGDEATVCPEGLRGQISEKARVGRSAQVVNTSHSSDDHNQAA